MTDVVTRTDAPAPRPRRAVAAPATIAVFGGCEEASPRTMHETALAGRLLGHRGLRVVYGGGSTGPTAACALAAARAGACVTAVTLPRWARDQPAPELIVSPGLLGQRTAALEQRADAFLVLPGGLGTRAELYSAWAARVQGLHDQLIVVLDPDATFADLWWDVRRQVAAGATARDALNHLFVVTAAAAAVDALVQATSRTGDGR